MDAETARTFLEALTGDWELDGEMGDVRLHQAVTARWTLGGRFVEMRCRQSDAPAGVPPYEALYHIGYAQDANALVMHLLDSTAVTPSCPVGVGRLDGDAVDFVFAYANGPFHNRFVFDRATDCWTHELVGTVDGRLRPFATKRLRRRAPR